MWNVIWKVVPFVIIAGLIAVVFFSVKHAGDETNLKIDKLYNKINSTVYSVNLEKVNMKKANNITINLSPSMDTSRTKDFITVN